MEIISMSSGMGGQTVMRFTQEDVAGLASPDPDTEAKRKFARFMETANMAATATAEER